MSTIPTTNPVPTDPASVTPSPDAVHEGHAMMTLNPEVLRCDADVQPRLALSDAHGATKRHGLLSVAAELGLLVATTPQEERVQEDQAAEDAGTGAVPKLAGYRAHDINRAQRTRLHWVETPKGYGVVSLVDRMLRVCPDGQGTYRLAVRKRDAWAYTRLVARLSQEFCFGIASDTARDAHILHMVREGATWRDMVCLVERSSHLWCLGPCPVVRPPRQRPYSGPRLRCRGRRNTSRCVSCRP
jgi:hypothetical protein